MWIRARAHTLLKRIAKNTVEFEREYAFVSDVDSSESARDTYKFTCRSCAHENK